MSGPNVYCKHNAL